MSRQAVMASVMGATLNVGKQSTGYIDASSIAGTNWAYSTLGNFRVFLKGTAGTSYNFPNSVAAGAPLIDAIQEISSSATKVTKIDMKFETGKGGRFSEPGLHYSGNISIWIDWESSRVKWSGLYSGEYPVSQGSNSRGIVFGIYQGDEAISAIVNSTVQMQNTDFQDDQRGGPTLTLEVDTNRNIVKLPLFYSGATRDTTTAGLNAVSYTITTDTGVVVTATPTPPAETPTVEVSGIKISELTPVSALQDDDLFVLSQDDASDGTYEASLNVTLANLKAGIEPPPILQTVAWANFNGKQKPDGSAIGATGPCKIEGSSTVASVEKVTTGQYQITLSQTMADHNYCVVATCGRQLTSESSAGAICFVEVDGKEVDNFTLSTRLINTGGTRVDMSYMGFVVMGELQA